MSYNKETGIYEGYIYKIINDVNDKVYIGQTITTIKERWHGHMSAALNDKNNSILYKAMRKYGRNKFHIFKLECVSAKNKEDLLSKLNMLEQKYIIIYNSLYNQNGYNLEKGGNNKEVPGRTVNKYDLQLKFLDSYISCSEAGRLNNIDGCTIYGCCKHNYYTAGGYIWSFSDENPLLPPYINLENNNQYINKKTSDDVKYQRRLQQLSWYTGERIFVYNSFGEIISIYDDIIKAAEELKTKVGELRLNLEGKNLHLNKKIIRYESDSFDKYPRSLQMQPITIYDLQGNFVANFECKRDVEVFLGTSSGEITKTLKRGGSCKGYLISEYGKPLERKLYRDHFEIEMLDDFHNVLKTFKNKHEVSLFLNMSDCHKALNNAIENEIKYAGCYWRIKQEYKVA